MEKSTHFPTGIATGQPSKKGNKFFALSSLEVDTVEYDDAVVFIDMPTTWRTKLVLTFKATIIFY